MRRALPLAAGLCLPVPAHAADPQAYRVSLVATPDPAVNAALAASSSLIALRQAPVDPFALIARARDDLGRLRLALDSEGFYAGGIAASIAGRALDDPALPAAVQAVPQGQSVMVSLRPTLGPRFTLGTVSLTGALPAAIRAGFALRPGQPARAAPVLAAGTALLAALQDDGYALAVVAPPVAIEHDDTHLLDIAYSVVAGPRLDLGPITLAGLQRVDPAYVRRRLLLAPGELYDPDKIEAARQDLASLPVFAAVRVQAADQPDANGRLPLRFDFTERLRHVVSFGGTYATDLGGAITTSWTDRDVFGRAEQLTLAVAATDLGGSDTRSPGYNVSATFLKPDWLRRDQTLQLDAIALREYLDTYDRTAETLDAIATRKLAPELSVSAGLSGTEEQVLQEGVTRDYAFVGLPLGLRYDTTGSLLLPIHGVRASLTFTPTESFGGTAGSATYALLQGAGSTYLNLAAPGRSVLALRATLAVVEGAGTFAVPPDQRLYAGGSATIRGYRYQYVGPAFTDGTPTGGTALDAGTVEFRQRFGARYGAALFLDAGQVSDGTPFTGALRAGVGAGVRYYTVIGPIRLDVATPLIAQRGAGAIEAYIGIGEAF